MSDQQTPPPAPQPAASPAPARPSTPEDVLRSLVPTDPAERRRAFSALLRAVVDDRPGVRSGGGE